MELQEKMVGYQTVNSYSTLNRLTEKTKNIWIVFHGMGYLSKFFLRYFDELHKEENYIIALQAPSKYYLNNRFQHVGASWLTRENTVTDTQNVLAYVDAVHTSENIPKECNLIVFGYSQGVSIATRWVVKKQLKCDHLVLYAGVIPTELATRDFGFLLENNTRITTLVGNQDEYIDKERLSLESKRIESIFRGRATQIIFDGKHEVKKQLIHNLV